MSFSRSTCTAFPALVVFLICSKITSERWKQGSECTQNINSTFSFAPYVYLHKSSLPHCQGAHDFAIDLADIFRDVAHSTRKRK